MWGEIARVNGSDVERARARGRSTTRLAVSADMREKMIEGMRGWANTPSRRGALLETIHHDGFRVEMSGAALGVVAFVFEGRPNVLADALWRVARRQYGGVPYRQWTRWPLRNASCIWRLSLRLPRPDCRRGRFRWWIALRTRRVGLFFSISGCRSPSREVPVRPSSCSVRWRAVLGTPVSLHGTGGAWIVVSETAKADHLKQAVVRSLDRKVCNTLNTCCLVGAKARDHARFVLEGLREAGAARGQPFKLHVAAGDEDLVPPALFETDVQIARAQGVLVEKQAEVIAREELGIEWEWEETPEVTLVRTESLDAAVDLFNVQSPRLVGALVSENPDEHERFFETLNAPFVGDGHTRWVDGQFALNKPELGLSNWAHGRLFARGAVLTGDSVYTVRTRYIGE